MFTFQTDVRRLFTFALSTVDFQGITLLQGPRLTSQFTQGYASVKASSFLAWAEGGSENALSPGLWCSVKGFSVYFSCLSL